MLVRFLGVALVLGEHLTVHDLFQQLAKRDGVEFEHRGETRIMHTDKLGAYYVACIVSVKDHQTLMRRAKEGGRWTVRPEERQPGKEIVDFNFLSLHDKTGRGLYQHYRGSLSTRNLENLLAREHVAIVNERRDEWIKASAGMASHSALLKQARKMHEGQLVLRNIVRQGDMKQLIAKLDEVSALQIDVTGIADEARRFEPLSPFVRATRMRLNFQAKVRGETVASKILRTISRDGSRDIEIDSGRVEGTENGVPSIIDFDSLPISQFGTFKFDEVAKEFRPHEFTRAPLLRELVKACHDNKSTFERPSQ